MISFAGICFYLEVILHFEGRGLIRPDERWVWCNQTLGCEGGPALVSGFFFFPYSFLFKKKFGITFIILSIFSMEISFSVIFSLFAVQGVNNSMFK